MKRLLASITASATFGHPTWWPRSPNPGSSEAEVFLPGTSSAGVADAMIKARLLTDGLEVVLVVAVLEEE